MTAPSASPPSPPRAQPAPAGSRQRADIQGLRAIAVIAVIAVHVGLSSVTGGFVGVDVFFAVSGFLITQQLIRSIERDGRVSLLGFYARRARRILPAATVVLLATVAYSSFALGFVRTKEIATDAVWSAFFAANFRFAALETDYFAADLPPSPLQHFWSLAVEEQFYLIWPVVVLAGVLIHRRRVARGRATPGGVRRGLAIAVGVIVVASLIYSVVLTTHDPAAAYFSPFTRGWELGLGALAALAIRDDGPQDGTARWRAQTLGAAGIFLIVAACLEFNDATPFPGTPALVPVLGSVFILVAGSLWHGPTVASRVLSIRPLTVLGNWSYSLYLWHFPLLVLPEIHLGRDLHWGERIGLVLLAVLLSALSYRYVEQPFRQGRLRMPNWGSVLLYPASVGLVIAVGIGGQQFATFLVKGTGHAPAITVAGSDASPSADPSAKASADASPNTTPSATPDVEVPEGPSTALVRASVEAAREDRRVPTDLSPALEDLTADTADVGACDYLEGSQELCVEGDPDGEKTMVLFGDSHARHWIPAFDQIAAETGYRAYYLVRPQCVGALTTPTLRTGDGPDTDCADFHDWALQQIKRLDPDLVLVSTSPGYADVYDGSTRRTGSDADAVLARGYRDLIDALRPLSDRLVWMRDVPLLDGDPGTCLGSNQRLGECLAERSESYLVRTNVQLEAAKAKNVEVLDPIPWVCWDDDCPPIVGSTVTYRDDQHLTTAYAAWLAGPLGSALGMW